MKSACGFLMMVVVSAVLVALISKIWVVRLESAPATMPPTLATQISASPSAAYTFCLPCHRPNGQGIEGVFPSLVRSRRLVGDARIAAAIVLHGFDSQGDPMAPRWGGRMVGLPQLSDADLAGALTFARSAWGNQADAVPLATVTAVRVLTANRTTPWTPTELATIFVSSTPAVQDH